MLPGGSRQLGCSPGVLLDYSWSRGNTQPSRTLISKIQSIGYMSLTVLTHIKIAFIKIYKELRIAYLLGIGHCSGTLLKAHRHA